MPGQWNGAYKFRVSTWRLVRPQSPPARRSDFAAAVRPARTITQCCGVPPGPRPRRHPAVASSSHQSRAARRTSRAPTALLLQRPPPPSPPPALGCALKRVRASAGAPLRRARVTCTRYRRLAVAVNAVAARRGRTPCAERLHSASEEGDNRA